MRANGIVVGIYPFDIYVETAFTSFYGERVYGIERVNVNEFRKPSTLKHGDVVRMRQDRRGWQVIESFEERRKAKR